jgi:hypothetical protein
MVQATAANFTLSVFFFPQRLLVPLGQFLIVETSQRRERAGREQDHREEPSQVRKIQETEKQGITRQSFCPARSRAARTRVALASPS